MSLLLTLNRFHTLFWCFHCWPWINKCYLVSNILPFFFNFFSHNSPKSFVNHSKSLLIKCLRFRIMIYNTFKNTVISPNFHTRKLGKITEFFEVQDKAMLCLIYYQMCWYYFFCSFCNYYYYCYCRNTKKNLLSAFLYLGRFYKFINLNVTIVCVNCYTTLISKVLFVTEILCYKATVGLCCFLSVNTLGFPNNTQLSGCTVLRNF